LIVAALLALTWSARSHDYKRPDLAHRDAPALTASITALGEFSKIHWLMFSIGNITVNWAERRSDTREQS
jgi:hypothetical protein